VLPRNLIRFNVLSGEAATEKVILLPGEDSQFKVLSVDAGGGPYQTCSASCPRASASPKQGLAVGGRGDRPGERSRGAAQPQAGGQDHRGEGGRGAVDGERCGPADRPGDPVELNFGSVRGDAPVGRNIILVNNRQGTQLELTKVEVDTPALRRGDPVAGRSALSGRGDDAGRPGQGRQKATLKIATNDASKPTIWCRSRSPSSNRAVRIHFAACPGPARHGLFHPPGGGGD